MDCDAFRRWHCQGSVGRCHDRGGQICLGRHIIQKFFSSLMTFTTGNRVFTVSQELCREPKLQLSVKPLFAESTWSGSRRRAGPRWRAPFAESILLSALGEGFSWRRHRRRRNGRLRLLNSPRARRTWLSAKKYTRLRVHFPREHYIFGEYFDTAHGKFSKKTSHFRVQSFSLIHVHSYNKSQIFCLCLIISLAPFCLWLLYLTSLLLSLYLILIRPIWTASA
jgi:hypothetical protein